MTVSAQGTSPSSAASTAGVRPSSLSVEDGGQVDVARHDATPTSVSPDGVASGGVVHDLGSAPEVSAAGALAIMKAEDALATAQGAVRVAVARLSEALSAAPRVSPTFKVAGEAERAARQAAQEAAQVTARRRRALADAEGDLEVARAALEDFTSGEVTATSGQLVAAQARIDKRERAVDAAAAAVLDAEEGQADAEARLGAAEDDIAALRGLAPSEPSTVLAARTALEAAQRQVEQAVLVVEHTREQVAQQTAQEAQEKAKQQEGQFFASLDAFVEIYVLPQWRHKLGSSTRWCAVWWRHAEAISRLEAVWEAWEVMRREPAPSMATWWRDHLDPHMRALTDVDGTFHRCSADAHEQHHQQAPVWPAQTVEDGLFATEPTAPEQPTRVKKALAEQAQREAAEREAAEQRPTQDGAQDGGGRPHSGQHGIEYGNEHGESVRREA